MLAGILAYNSRIGVFSENERMLKDSVEGIFQQEDVIAVSIFNHNGKLLKKKELADDGEGRKATRSFNISNSKVIRIQQIVDRLKEDPSILHFEGKDQLEFWAPVISGSGYSAEEALFFEENPLERKNRIIGFVEINIDKKIFNKRLNDILLKSILIAMSFLSLGAGILYFVVQGITNPLKRLTQRVNYLEIGENVEKIPVETRDEIGKLAIAFNNMLESLKNREAEKSQLESQLRHAQKIEAIGTLAGGIAHDFNNILGIILGYTELALLEIPESTSLERKLNEIFKASNRAKDLVNQILTFSRQGEQERKPIRISLIIKEVLKMLRASLPATIEIRQNINNNLSMVLSDPTQIHQVLMNLCTNAAHAMRDKSGILEVSLVDVDVSSKVATMNLDMNPGRYQKIMVRDTGHGMESAVLERIFEPFFTTKGPGEGTGMGLAVVHGIVKSHGGAVAVQSKIGEGTTFEVFFPCVVSETATEYEAIVPIPFGNERVLFVDDEEALVSIGAQMMECLGYEVVAKKSGIEALKDFSLQPDKFNLVITDMTMPNMTGLDLAKEIKRIRSDIPIILCTGFSNTLSIDKAKKIGIQNFIMKPIMQQELAATIRRILDQKNEP
ncbi:MAG: response regulator [Desulfobacterales bacterium]|nr:response regulator [Desulfobacterales bacterium]